MAKVRAKKRARTSPCLGAALVCEKVRVAGDKVPSFMRVVDQVTLPRPASPIPHDSVVAMNLTLVVSFRAGGFGGVLPLKIERIGPSKERVAFIEHPMEFVGKLEESSATVGIGMHLKWDGEGVYWFDVFLGSTWYTRVPLRISLAKESSSKSSSRKTGRKAKN